MKIKITGSSGYLGTLNTKHLKEKGHIVEGIQRELLYGPSANLSKEIADMDAIINFAGAPILTRWTEKNKKIIYESRVKTTQNLVKAINELNPENRPKKFISASATGIYKTGKSHDESSTDYSDDFMGNVVQDWEKAMNGLSPEVQKIIFRMAPVIGRKSEMIKQMWLPFKLGMGGKIGNGEQPFPFVHETDVARAYAWGIEEYLQNGLFNLVAPDQISNREFTETFAQKLHRPAFFRVPGFGLKLLYGEAAETLTEGQTVIPLHLKKAGFTFLYPTIDKAMEEIVASKNPAA